VTSPAGGAFASAALAQGTSLIKRPQHRACRGGVNLPASHPSHKIAFPLQDLGRRLQLRRFAPKTPLCIGDAGAGGMPFRHSLSMLRVMCATEPTLFQRGRLTWQPCAIRAFAARKADEPWRCHYVEPYTSSATTLVCAKQWAYIGPHGGRGDGGQGNR
jgi:hypothetical protein